MIAWLRTEFSVDSPGAQLADAGVLDEEAFVAEVYKRLPRSARHLTPAALKHLREGYREQAVPAQTRVSKTRALEQRLADLINAAYELTPEEVALLWATAPPRMPLSPPHQSTAKA